MDFVIKDKCLVKYTGNGGVVDIPKGIEIIGETAFIKSAAEVINIPKGVKSINSGAFCACTKLKTVNISETIEFIGDNVFYGDIYLTEINVSPKNPFFKSINGVLYDKEIKTLLVCPKKVSGVFAVPEGIEEIKELSFDTCSSITEIKLPPSVDKIGGRAFWGCAKLEKINISGSIKKLPNSVFYNCAALKEFAVPEGIEEIGDRAFGYCFYLKKAVIASSVKKIGENCFRDCFRLEEVILPKGLESIGSWAFFDCYKLKNITIPQSVKHLGEDVFGYCKELIKVEVLSENLDDESFFALSDLKEETDVSIFSVPPESVWENLDQNNKNRFIKYALKNIKSLKNEVKLKFAQYIKENTTAFIPHLCTFADISILEFLAQENIINNDTMDLFLEFTEENPQAKAWIVDYLGRNVQSVPDLFESALDEILSL